MAKVAAIQVYTALKTVAGLVEISSLIAEEGAMAANLANMINTIKTASTLAAEGVQIVNNCKTIVSTVSSSTVVGLVVTGVLETVSMGINARSVHRTRIILRQLEEIRNNLRKGSVLGETLEFIIRRKKEKLARRSASLVPVLGSLGVTICKGVREIHRWRLDRRKSKRLMHADILFNTADEVNRDQLVAIKIIEVLQSNEKKKRDMKDPKMREMIREKLKMDY